MTCCTHPRTTTGTVRGGDGRLMAGAGCGDCGEELAR